MIVDCAHYRDGARQHEGPKELAEAARCVGEGESEFVWVGLYEPSEGEMDQAAELFGLHELAVEDASRAHQRPKMEDYGDSFFIVLKTARYHDETEDVHFGEIDIFLGAGYVVVVRHGEGTELRSARKRLEERQDLLKLGPASVVWAIVDKVVDDYMPVMAGIDDDIEEVEQAVFDTESEPTQRVYFLKREVIEFHRAVFPLLAPLESIERGAFPNMDDQLRRYLRDVADHARRVDETINSQRELLTSVLEANLALVSVRQNEVVKKISGYAALIAVPTFMASIWGMNFEYMPELDWRVSYPLALLAMALVVGVSYRFLRRVGWI